MKALRRNHTSTKSNPSSNPTPNNNNNNNVSSNNEISPTSSSSSWIQLRSVLLIVASSSPSSSSSSSSSSANSSPYSKPRNRGHLKSPWSRRKRKHALLAHQWRNSFGNDGKLRDGGIKLLKKIRSGGVDPSIRAEVWPFLLGVYDLNSTKEERDVIRNKNRKEYEKLRRQCRQLRKQFNDAKQKETGGRCSNGSSDSPSQAPSSPTSEDVVSARDSLSSERGSSDVESENNSTTVINRSNSSPSLTTNAGQPLINSDSSDSESSEDDRFDEVSSPFEQENNLQESPNGGSSSPPKMNIHSNVCRFVDFASWQRIIRLDAIRANAEWKSYSPAQSSVGEDRARRCAEAVGLKDYEHLEPCRVYHAARLVAILEAYAVYDSEIGYCQGMSDLLSPMISIIEDDHMAFWCFVGFMKKARHNFRLDEVGIRRQLNIVAKVIKYKDSHLYRHLVKLQAEDCFFVYRMVVVLFRRELSFEQTLCLWEVMWADQAALRAGIGKSAWSRIRQRAPPTEDLLLYAIAASVLQRRKQIVEKYNSMDDILRECNNMAGQLDVWKLLDDAHDLVMTLHEKIDSNLSRR